MRCPCGAIPLENVAESLRALGASSFRSPHAPAPYDTQQGERRTVASCRSMSLPRATAHARSHRTALRCGYRSPTTAAQGAPQQAAAQARVDTARVAPTMAQFIGVLPEDPWRSAPAQVPPPATSPV